MAGVLGVQNREMIAVYGGGGKTTLLQNLARELAAAGGKIVLTTTTKIFPPAGIPVVINPDPAEAKQQLKKLLQYHPVVCLGSALLPPQGKLVGMSPALLGELFKGKVASHFLVEADGAARRPIKGYASYEPVIPPAAGLILPVVGLDALGAVVHEQTVHRPELFALQSGAEPGLPLELDNLLRSLNFMVKRGLKAVPYARTIPVLNKVDLINHNEELKTIGETMQEGLRGVKYFIFSAAREAAGAKIVLAAGCAEKKPGSAKQANTVKTGPAVSCVVLAAGSGRRMGQDKLFLTIGEKTILEHAVDSALESGVDEVILVTRPHRKKAVAELFGDRNVRVVTNRRHREGMASSLQAGLAAVSPLAQGVIFTLGDQPFITPEVYNALIDSYQQHWNLITAPLYQGTRGNPVLLDRRVWPQVMELQGDTGGRELFSRTAEEDITLLELGRPEILHDIDTQEDYRRFIAAAEKNESHL